MQGKDTTSTDAGDSSKSVFDNPQPTSQPQQLPQTQQSIIIQQIVDVQALITENTTLKLENQALKNEVRDLKNQIQGLISHMDTNKTRLESHEQRLNLEQRKGDDLQAQCNHLREENDRLKEEQRKLNDEYIALKLKYDNTMKENETLNQKITTLMDDKASRDALLMAHDAARMFIYYRVQPGLPQGKFWRDYTESILDKKADVQEGLITQDQFNEWIAQTFPAVTVSVERIQQLNNDRTSIAHRDIRSVPNQKVFLSELEKYPWPASFPYKNDLQAMLTELKSVQLYRFK